jgi:hypothetical protein
MSSRGTYQRGAKPASNKTTERVVSAIARLSSLTTNVARCGDLDAVIGVGGVADYAFVFLAEGVYCSPGQRDSALQHTGMVGQSGVLPRSMLGAPVSGARAEPRGLAEVVVLLRPSLAEEDVRPNLGEREVGGWIAAGLVEKDHILAVGDPLAT